MTVQMQRALEKMKQVERTNYNNADLNRLRDDLIALIKITLDVADTSPDPRLAGGWRDPHDAR